MWRLPIHIRRNEFTHVFPLDVHAGVFCCWLGWCLRSVNVLSSENEKLVFSRTLRAFDVYDLHLDHCSNQWAITLQCTHSVFWYFKRKTKISHRMIGASMSTERAKLAKREYSKKSARNSIQLEALILGEETRWPRHWWRGERENRGREAIES